MCCTAGYYLNSLHVLLGCLVAYEVNFIGNLSLRKYGFLDRLSGMGVQLLSNESPQAFVVASLTYLILLWMLSHLLSIVIAALYQTSWNNHQPRDNAQLHAKGTLASRLYAAHQNANEQFVFIATSVVLCVCLKVDYSVINRYMAGIIFFRTIFHLAYALNIDFVRSLAYEMAIGGMLLLMFNACVGSSRAEEYLDSIQFLSPLSLAVAGAVFAAYFAVAVLSAKRDKIKQP